MRRGNSVWVIDTTGGAIDLQRASRWEVSGASAAPETWTYKVEIATPNGTIKQTVASAGIVHMRLDGEDDWLGLAPWQHADMTADAMAEVEGGVRLEGGVRDESRIYSGRV